MPNLILIITLLAYGFQQSPTTALQSLIDRQVADGLPGMVLWVDTPTWDFAGASGYADVEQTIPMQPTDAFRIASLTKLFTATVILQLAEEGELNLDDPLNQWLPQFNYPSTITLRHLLNHTSGIPNYTADYVIATQEKDMFFRPWTPDAIVMLVHDYPLDFPPGSLWKYSNTNYILLGMVIEAVTGQSLAANYHKRICDPLEMHHTYLAEFEPPIGEMVQGTSYFFSAELFDASITWAAGGLVSTAPDLIRFTRALFQGELFARESTLDEMLTFVNAIGAGHYHGYGLGVEMTRTPLGQVWGHDGSIAGFTANLMYFPAGDIVVVALVNADMTFGVDKAALYRILANSPTE